MDKVSVIIPAYNTAKYVQRCLESVISQTYTNIEVLLVDDGSTDETSDICRKYAEQDDRVKYYKKENGGVATARNYALDMATGDYILFVDSDDYISSHMVEKLLDARGTDNSMVICGMSLVFKNQECESMQIRSNNEVVFSRHDYARKLVQWGPVCKLFKRNIVKDIYFPQVKLAEDLTFISDIICKNENFKIAVINESLYYYVIHDNSAMTREYNEDVLINVFTQEKVLRKFLNNNISVENSGILRNAIEVFFWKYYSQTKVLQREYREDLKKVKNIMKSNKKYLLERGNIINRKKMFVFMYFPMIYSLYMRMKRK